MGDGSAEGRTVGLDSRLRGNDGGGTGMTDGGADQQRGGRLGWIPACAGMTGRRGNDGWGTD